VNAQEDRWNERLKLQEEQRLEEQKQQQEQRTPVFRELFTRFSPLIGTPFWHDGFTPATDSS